MENLSYQQVCSFSGVVISISSLSNGKPIIMKEVAEHEFEVGDRTVKVPLHWFYPKMLKNAEKGRPPVFVKMHIYSKFLKTILETGKPENILVKVKVSRKLRDGKVSDIILDVYPEQHNAEAKYDLVFTRTNDRAIFVPNALEKICFVPRNM
jgi:hypothetical protein